MALSIQQSKTSLDVTERFFEVSEHFSSFWPFNETCLAIHELSALVYIPKRFLSLWDRKVSGLLAMLTGGDTEQWSPKITQQICGRIGNCMFLFSWPSCPFLIPHFLQHVTWIGHITSMFLDRIPLLSYVGSLFDGHHSPLLVG